MGIITLIVSQIKLHLDHYKATAGTFQDSVELFLIQEVQMHELISLHALLLHARGRICTHVRENSSLLINLHSLDLTHLKIFKGPGV